MMNRYLLGIFSVLFSVAAHASDPPTCFLHSPPADLTEALALQSFTEGAASANLDAYIQTTTLLAVCNSELNSMQTAYNGMTNPPYTEQEILDAAEALNEKINSCCALESEAYFDFENYSMNTAFASCYGEWAAYYE